MTNDDVNDCWLSVVLVLYDTSTRYETEKFATREKRRLVFFFCFFFVFAKLYVMKRLIIFYQILGCFAVPLFFHQYHLSVSTVIISSKFILAWISYNGEHPYLGRS